MLLGWIEDVFQKCTPNWDRESLIKELDFVSRIFITRKRRSTRRKQRGRARENCEAEASKDRHSPPKS
uniref:Uncharacterized protein n=1 Tax=Brassica oleracea TaxID=3712 RepID=A0A3P6E1M1_BRAOL|nr:unnamed protein product [Brassica oleracea]